MILKRFVEQFFIPLLILAIIFGTLRSCSNTGSGEVKDKSKMVVAGFFNGIMTTEHDARKSLNYLCESAVSKPKIKCELFYNYTDGLATDLLELFEQRMVEWPAVLQGRFELFFEATRGRGSLTDSLTKAEPTLPSLLDSFLQPAHALMVANLNAVVFGNGKKVPTKQVYREHKAKADSTLKSGRRLVLIAHSQGNLFANALLGSFSKKAQKDIQVVHVAPASQVLNGKHVLADKDTIIAGLKNSGQVAPVTVSIPDVSSRPPGGNGKTDPYGHGMIEIYLNEKLDTYNEVKENIDAVM